MATIEQLTALIDFMEEHKDLALGTFARSKEGRSQTKRLWVEASNLLNSVSSGCRTKTGDQWRLYYNEYKSKLVKKIKANKSEISATGGGPHKIMLLTPLQERLYAILGLDIGEPLPGVRHDPFYHEDSLAQIPDIQIPEKIPDVEEEQIVFDCIYEPGTSRQEIELPIESAPNHNDALEPSQPDQQTTPAPPPTQRRRRRPQARTSRATPRTSSRNEDEPALRQASEHLAAMETTSAEATREHAQSIRTLAAAIEKLADRLTQPIVLCTSACCNARPL